MKIIIFFIHLVYLIKYNGYALLLLYTTKTFELFKKAVIDSYLILFV